MSASQTLTFDQPRVVIGRGTHSDVRLPSLSVSSTHAVLRKEGSELSIMDEGSTNGTLVNGALVVRGRKKVLREGDKIVIPGYELTVSLTSAMADLPDRTASVARKLLADALLLAGQEGAPPSLILKPTRGASKEWAFKAAPSRMVVGRGDNCEIMLDDPDCSRHHAEFIRDEVGVIVRDLNSKNGVLVGGRRWPERRLKDGDDVQLGRVVLSFSDPAEALLKAFEMGTDQPQPVDAPRASTIPPGPAGVQGQASGAGSGPLPLSQPPPSISSPANAPSDPQAGLNSPEAALPAKPQFDVLVDIAEPYDPSSPHENTRTGVGQMVSTAEAAKSSDPNAPKAPPTDALNATLGDKRELGKTGATSTARRAKSRTLDWIVALLALLILSVSVIALVLVLRTH